MRKKSDGIISISDIVFAAVIAAVCIIVFICFFTGPKAETVVISQEGRVLYELPLSGNTVKVIDGMYSNTVVIENGSVHVEDSTCPNHICEKGSINAVNESIVCAPNRLTVTITGEGEVDAVTE